MTMFYSKSTTGFFVSEIHGTNMPDDVVSITVDYHQTLMIGQDAGKQIKADQTGYPILVDVPVQTEAELIATANAGIIEQINAIERDLQPRAMRDTVLYNDNSRLKSLDAQIKELRTKLR